jgi:long-subunit fatty acid transport protein
MRALTAALCLLASAAAFADEFHYKNVLVGERAAGLGGAFTAISDDPSAIYYNPAGLVFSLENYFSLTANGYSVTKEKYRDVAPDLDYTYSSSTLIPVFFGFTQAFGRTKFAFGVVVPNSDLLDQDDVVSGISAQPSQANVIRRRFFRQDTTYLAGPAFAREIAPNLTVGVSVLGFARLDKAIDNIQVIFNPATAGAPLETGRYRDIATYQDRNVYGLFPKLGVQYMPAPKWSVGLTLSRRLNLAGNGKQKINESRTDATGVPVAFTGSFKDDKILSESGDLGFEVPTVTTLSMGTAYFLTRGLLVSGDLDIHGPDTEYFNYPVKTTVNWSLGGEYYVTESFAARAGVYSNNANTFHLSPGGVNQSPHVDLIGLTVGLSLFKPGSSLTVGASYASGKGQGQAFFGNPTIHEIESYNATVYFTGSYQL